MDYKNEISNTSEGSYYTTNLICQFQKAIEQEIETISKGTKEHSIKLTMGELVASSSDNFVYRFLLEKSISLPDDTPLDVIVTGSKYSGHIVSFDIEGINIGLDTNLGEIIQSATIFIQYSKLLEILHGRFESVKTGKFNLNSVGCLKLFGSYDTKLLSEPIQKHIDLSKYNEFLPNNDQEKAIVKSLSQEVTFVWGPPGTGKTRVLSIILDQFVQANKKVLLVSHTNLAVDEILLKYLDNPESNEHVKAGRIIRHGPPAKKDDGLDALLIDNIVKTTERKKIEDIKFLESSSRVCNIILSECDDDKFTKLITLLDTLENKSRNDLDNCSETHNSIKKIKNYINNLFFMLELDSFDLYNSERTTILNQKLSQSPLPISIKTLENEESEKVDDKKLKFWENIDPEYKSILIKLSELSDKSEKLESEFNKSILNNQDSIFKIEKDIQILYEMVKKENLNLQELGNQNILNQKLTNNTISVVIKNIETEEKEKLCGIKSLKNMSFQCNEILLRLSELHDQSRIIELNLNEKISENQNSIEITEKNIHILDGELYKKRSDLQIIENAGIIRKLISNKSKKRIIEDVTLIEKKLEIEKQKSSQLRIKLIDLKEELKRKTTLILKEVAEQKTKLSKIKIVLIEKEIETEKQKLNQLQTELKEQKEELDNMRTLILKEVDLEHRKLIQFRIDLIHKETESKYKELHQLNSYFENLENIRQETTKQYEKVKSQLKEIYDKLQIPSNTPISLKHYDEAKRSLTDNIKANKEKIESIKKEIQLSKETIFSNALVVGCTLTKAYTDSKLLNTKFDVMVLDEASMAQLPAVFFIAGIIKKNHYVIAGDFRQLSPIASSESLEAKMWLKRDIFAQAGIEENVNNNIEDKRLVMLREQYRMHESIANLINNAMYNGKLLTSETTIKVKNEIAALSPFKNHALCLVNTSSINPLCKITSFGSRINIYSAFLSVSLAKKALKGKIKTIGIITPYNAQAKLINSFLKEEDLHRKGIISATIHKFQGNEKECIIFDPVDSPPHRKGKILSGPYQKSEAGELINVAISRAKGKFFLIANREYVYQNFKAEEALFCLLNDIERSGKSIDAKKILPSTFYQNIEKNLLSENRLNSEGSQDKINQYLTIWNEKNFYDIFTHELLLAEKRVVIFSPFIARKRVSELGDVFGILIEKGIKIYVVTRSPMYQGTLSIDDTEYIIEDLKKMDVDVIIASEKVKLHNKLHEKCALIDDDVFFYGSLNILSQSDSSETMVAIKSKPIINNLVKEFKINTIIQMYENPQMKTNAHEKQNGNEQSQFIIDKIEVALRNETKIDNCPNCQSSFVLMSDKENLYWCCPVDLKKGFEIRKNIPQHLIETTIHNLKINCHKCNNGHLRYKIGKYGPFLSCNQYPMCKNTLNFR